MAKIRNDRKGPKAPPSPSVRTNTMKVGPRIREVRKRAGLTMRQLAEKLGVSYLTIQRIETDGTSPSVALLSDIAHHLNRPIISFLLGSDEKAFHIKAADQPVIESGNLKLRLLAPRGLVGDDINITVGMAKKGELAPKHTTNGFEVAYCIRGKVIFRQGSKEYRMDEGDFLYHDGRVPHSVEALEDHEFLGIHFVK
ncbi:MAG: helix-turn-helix domain-containing protein [Pseudomonadota bacterium]